MRGLEKVSNTGWGCTNYSEELVDKFHRRMKQGESYCERELLKEMRAVRMNSA